MRWIDYVTEVAAGDTQTVIGYKSGVSGATISRWSTSAPRPESVAAFARAYNRPVLEAFVAAGFLTEEEAGQTPAGHPRLSELSTDALLREVRNRMVHYTPEPGVEYDEDISALPKLPRR